MQYYINRKKCGGKEVQHSAPYHGNSSAKEPFLQLRQNTFQDFKKRDKRVVSVLYDNVTQMRNEDSNYGDLPRSKKKLIDLSPYFLKGNEVGDIKKI